jgi:hypothetical protein
MKHQRKQVKPVNEQHRRFVETARQLEADEDKTRFEERLGRIAKAKPKPTLKKR